MNKLYFGLLPSGTIADTFVVGVAGFDDTFVKPCIPILTPSGSLVYREHEDYVIQFSSPNSPLHFRSIDWSTKIDSLKLFLDNTDKNVWIGTTRPEQLTIIKDAFNDRAFTISINYNEDTYSKVLSSYQLFIEEQPLTLDLELLPKSKNYSADYNINLDELFDQSKFVNHLLNVGITLNDSKLQFYETWLTVQ